VNFDFPKTLASYTHRVGRTARAGTSGTALSFVNIADASSSKKETELAAKAAKMLYDVRMQQPRLEATEGDSALAAMGSVQDQAFAGNDEGRKQPGPLLFNLKELDSFRYRVEDTLRAVTDLVVSEFRTAELKQELLNSTKLKSFFAANPNDLKVLRHEKGAAAPIRAKSHLKHIPDYLVPVSMKNVQHASNNQNKKRRRAPGQTQSQRIQQSKDKDPLLGGAIDGPAEDLDAGQTFEDGPAPLGLHESTSGRKKWQARHKKGSFNEKQAKKSSHRLPGSFTKSKAYK
jgi:ATP-dependent RNA helicase DDX56/DBP9